MKTILILAALAALTTAPAIADGWGSGLPDDQPCHDAWMAHDYPAVIEACDFMAMEAHEKAQTDPGNAMTDLLVESQADILVAKAYLYSGNPTSARLTAHKAWVIDGIIVQTVDPNLFRHTYELALQMWNAAAEVERQADGQ